jgi:hypothetical protein
MTRSPLTGSSLLWAVPVFLAVACAGGGSDAEGPRTAGGSDNGSGGTVIGGTGGTSTVTACTGSCTDFPSAPLTDGTVAPDAATRFGPAGSGSQAGPCILEPQNEALVPRNWLRPRVRFTPAAGENLFEIRVHADVEANDLVAYTDKTTWTMDKGTWENAAAHVGEGDLTFTVRALKTGSSAPTVSTSVLHVAPVDAGGALVYWATTSSAEGDATSKLVGYTLGEDNTIDALRVSQVAEANLWNETGTQKAGTYAAAGRVSCIGCHASTPDGKAVIFNDGWPWAGVMASVEKDTVGQRPTYVTDMGARLIQQPFVGAFAFSKGVWGDGKYIGISSYSNATGVGWDGVNNNIVTQTRLAWFDLAAAGTVPAAGTDMQAMMPTLQGKAFGFLDRTGDSRGAANPRWSHDGKTIVYESTAQVAGGHVGYIDKATGLPPVSPVANESDIYTVPFADKKGGAASAVAGASEAGVAEYYPDFSADDSLIAYTRVASGTGYFYYRKEAEIYVVPAAGGTAARLVANDPPACSGEKSPGIVNSWPRWSPSVLTSGTKSYYFLTFSSARTYPEQFKVPPNQYTPTDIANGPSSQLYMAAIVVQDGKVDKTYPGVYLWSQTKATSNLTPAWDEFKIPPADVK